MRQESSRAVKYGGTQITKLDFRLIHVYPQYYRRMWHLGAALLEHPHPVLLG